MKTTRSKTGVVNFDDPVFFDLETSGTDFNKHQIIQIGAVRPATGKTFECLLKFDVKAAAPEALKVNHYDAERWKEEAVSQSRGLEMFSDWLGSHRTLARESRVGNTYYVVAGAGFRVDRFDFPFLVYHMKERGIFCPMDFRVLDVIQLALWVLPGLPDYSLTALLKHCGLKQNDLEHDAVDDCWATVRLASHLLKDIYDDDSLPDWTVEL